MTYMQQESGLFEQAERAMARGNFSEVVDLLVDVRGTIPKSNVRPWQISKMLGQAQLNEEQLANGLETLLLASDQECSDFKRFRSKSGSRSGKKVKKAKQEKKAKKGVLPDGLSCFLAARALILAGRPDEAVAHCKKSLPFFPTSWQLYDVMAQGYADLGQIGDAKACYAEMVKKLGGQVQSSSQIFATCAATLAAMNRREPEPPSVDKADKVDKVEESAGYVVLNKPSLEEFLEASVYVGKPAIIRGLIDEWPANREWSLPRLVERFGDEKVKIRQSRDVTDGIYYSKRPPEGVAFKEYIDTLGQDGSPYLFSDIPFRSDIEADYSHPELFKDFSWPEVMRNVRSLFYVGDKGSGVSLHQHSAAWNALIEGEKQWYFLPPYRHYGRTRTTMSEWMANETLSSNSRLVTLTQRAGEVVFVPQYVYHGVENRGCSVGIVMQIGSYPGLFETLL